VPECRALLSNTPRLPGVDGRKASKSLGNAISLSASADEIRDKVRAMFTDSEHVRASDPGRVEGNVVFAYLDAFDSRRDEVEDLKRRYRAGGLGDVALKARLDDVLQAILEPIRSRRALLARDPAAVQKIIRSGSERSHDSVASVLSDVRDVFFLNHPG
jgi:tryptophanyl-tRNA synthetase